MTEPWAVERARMLVDLIVWPTSEGPFVRVNDKPRDLESLVSAIALALTEAVAEQRDLLEASIRETDSRDELIARLNTQLAERDAALRDAVPIVHGDKSAHKEWTAKHASVLAKVTE